MRATLLALGLVAVVGLAPHASGSLVANLTGIQYQNDAGSGRDADDACVPPPAGPRVFLRPGSNRGMLFPLDDRADAYGYRVQKPEFTVLLLPEAAWGFHHMRLRVLDAACMRVLGDAGPNEPLTLPNPGGSHVVVVVYGTKLLGPGPVHGSGGEPTPEQQGGVPACYPSCYLLDAQ